VIEVLLGCVLILATWLAPYEARAAEDLTRIVVVRQAEADAAMSEVATRAWAELTAAGLRAELVDCTDQRSCRGESARPNELLATVATFRRDGQTVTEIDIAGAGRAPSVERTIVAESVDAENPRVVAIQVVERVRAALLRTRVQVAIPARTAAATTAIKASNDDELPAHLIPARRGPKWSLGAGPTVVESAGGLGRGYGAVARADYFFVESLGAALMVGAARGTNVPAASGAVDLQQTFAVLELVHRFLPSARLRPHLSLGAGAFHVAAEFAPNIPSGAAGGSDSLWALLLSSGAGAGQSRTRDTER